MTIEEQIKYVIKMRYGTLKRFSEATGVPYSTLYSALNNDITGMSFKNLEKVCRELRVDISSIGSDKIEYERSSESDVWTEFLMRSGILDCLETGELSADDRDFLRIVYDLLYYHFRK